MSGISISYTCVFLLHVILTPPPLTSDYMFRDDDRLTVYLLLTLKFSRLRRPAHAHFASSSGSGTIHALRASEPAQPKQVTVGSLTSTTWRRMMSDLGALLPWVWNNSVLALRLSSPPFLKLLRTIHECFPVDEQVEFAKFTSKLMHELAALNI